MRVSICIGSACHLKGSREVIQKLQKLVSENHLDSEVDLNGDFCSGNCRKGVCVTVDGELYSVKPETTEEFFQKEIQMCIRDRFRIMNLNQVHDTRTGSCDDIFHLALL